MKHHYKIPGNIKLSNYDINSTVSIKSVFGNMIVNKNMVVTGIIYALILGHLYILIHK